MTDLRFIYRFTPDEIKALAELEKTLPKSARQEVIAEILELVSIDGYRNDSYGI